MVRAAYIPSELMYSNLNILFSSHKGTEKSFKLDPRFPDLLYNSGFASTMRFLQSFLADYSKRGLSKSSDRAVAISGLAARIQKALGRETRYGIFGFFLHRTLLWQRSGLQKMKRIEYGDSKVPSIFAFFLHRNPLWLRSGLQKMKRIKYGDSKVPSWSWMAYEGGIQFTEVPYGDLDLDLFDDLRFAPPQDKTALITKVWKFQGCHLGEALSETTRHQILDSRGTERGWILYDVEDGEDLRGERGVVVARRRRIDIWSSDSQQLDRWGYYILVVRQIAGEYKRVGIGRVHCGYVSRQEPDVRIL